VVSEDREQFISEEDRELNRIRQEKLKRYAERRKTVSTKPAHVTDESFSKVCEQNSLALIDFWASWCGPCSALAPTIEDLAKEMSGKVFVGKLNVDENPDTASCYKVFSIPTVLIMKDGKEVDRIVGCVPKESILSTLKKYMK
jgi:thioredoxin 1